MIYYFLNKRWQFIVNGQVKLKQVEIYQLVYNGLQMQKKKLGSIPKNWIGRVSGIWIYNLLNFFSPYYFDFFFLHLIICEQPFDSGQEAQTLIQAKKKQ